MRTAMRYMLKSAATAVPALLLGFALNPIAASAESAPPKMVKTWFVSGTGTIVRLAVARTGSTYTVHPVGLCAATCGTAPLVIYPEAGTGRTMGVARYSTPASSILLTLFYLGEHSLTVQVFTAAKDGSGKNTLAYVSMH